MGVRVIHSKTFKTDVKFDVLDENGKPEQMKFVAEFKRLSRDEVQEMLNTCGNDSEMCRLVLVGWKITRLDTGEDWPYTPENLEEYLAQTGYAGATMLRFMDTVGASRGKP